MITLPAITSEKLSVELTSWAREVLDPTTLAWRALVSADHHVETNGPSSGDSGWVDTVCELVGGKYFIQVPLQNLTPGFYGAWVRVNGSAYSSPARWCGQVRLT